MQGIKKVKTNEHIKREKMKELVCHKYYIFPQYNPVRGFQKQWTSQTCTNKDCTKSSKNGGFWLNKVNVTWRNWHEEHENDTCKIWQGKWKKEHHQKPTKQIQKMKQP